ncbi:TIGR02594 family protein, partial [Salmonella enterica subsp. enterica serovar Zongo]|nr:TIGR02594 family protein [Salmonella enterica subsp. enterica serovar Zongo]
MSEPKWLAEARRYIGEREIKGAQHNPLIVQMWRDIKRGGIKDDETPWCAAFVGAVLEHVGIKSTRFESAG